MFGHWFEILILLGLGLLVFGPKRMVEMGSQFGKMFRELQSSLKEMNWSLTGSANDDKPTTGAGATITKLSEYAQNALSRTSGNFALDREAVESVPATPTSEAAPASEKVGEPTPEEAAKSALN